MRCPRCRAAMLIIERNQIELDHCLACGGIWFDGEELELLFASRGLDAVARRLQEIMAMPPRKVAEKRLRCPRCGRRMDKAQVGPGGGVVLDRCRRGDGLWFDGGELPAVVAHLERTPAGAVGEALAFVEEVFPPAPAGRDAGEPGEPGAAGGQKAD